jgi:hypothetical protein
VIEIVVSVLLPSSRLVRAFADAAGLRQSQPRERRTDDDFIAVEVLGLAGLQEARNAAGKAAGFGSIGPIDQEHVIPIQLVGAIESISGCVGCTVTS